MKDLRDLARCTTCQRVQRLGVVLGRDQQLGHRARQRHLQEHRRCHHRHLSKVWYLRLIASCITQPKVQGPPPSVHATGPRLWIRTSRLSIRCAFLADTSSRPRRFPEALRAKRERSSGWGAETPPRCGTEAGSYLRLIDACITQLKAQGPSRTCNESKEEEEVCPRHRSAPQTFIPKFRLCLAFSLGENVF